ncbi:hypothetical protein BGW36DRAFT_104450 [Talaromyces proteolyticus]|uniref:MARVEL domain-containing protein n=1 Tax=Talaromyces proteolyticus TaxID=1131652 RepID=A0AAD4KWS3_9EURO|nr:uncharacterized protein BGW36DRAFT_104450 [Talaromyces proteolyticus]KAH8701740.1 hypothetical protein BGW36DRAFT_104450 [Talaromyces proteolyticus]
MFFFVFKLLGFGVKQAKKRRNGGGQHDGWYNNGNREMQSTPGQMLRGPGDRPASIFLLDTILRFFQFVMGLTVIGLYGVDIHHAHEKKVHADSKWVYAEITASIATITATIYLLLPCCMKSRSFARIHATHLPSFVWEGIICILWLTLFGIFGKMYIGENPEGDSGITRMKHAVWVDLTNLLLWAISATWCGLRWWKGKATAPEPFESDKIYEPQPPLQPPPPQYPPQ